MSVDVIVLYRPPADPAAFDRHYRTVHVPLVLAMPHLVSFEITDGPVDTQGGDEVHFVARLRFRSQADLDASLASPEGAAAVGDLANFAQAGAILVTTPVVAL
jgi:uncharacterized protein (TIGR02118 family)